MKSKFGWLISSLTLILIIFSLRSFSQTPVFTYQGKLGDMGTPPTGTYQMEFRLFDVASGGAPIGMVANNSVAVAEGAFTVNLNFEANAFPGADRFLQISVRRSAAESFVTLNPRYQITSSPYSIRTLSAALADDSAQLGGVAANQYLQTNGNGSALTNLNAASISTGTLSNSRLGQIPNANIADNAVTSSKIAAGQVVKGVAVGATTLADNVTLAAGPNITLTPAGNMVTIAATGSASGVTGGGTEGFLPLFSGDTAIGDSLISQSGGFINMPSVAIFAPSLTGHRTQIGTPNTETGVTFSGTGARADIRYDGTLKIVNGPGGIQSAANGIAINTSGNVGVGTPNPITKLHLTGNAAQDRSSGGFVKAMLSVAADGTITQCYNGLTGSSAGNCGFLVSAGANGNYSVNLGFQVTDRFLSVTARGINGTINIPPAPISADYRFSTLPGSNPNVVTIDTFRPDTGQTANNPFMLIIY